MAYPHSGHPSAAGRAHDRESTPAKERRYTAVPRNQQFDGVLWLKLFRTAHLITR